MAPLPPAEKILRISSRGDLAGHPWAAVMHARYTGLTIDQAIIDDVALSCFDAWSTNLSLAQSTAAILQEVVVSDLSAANPIDGVVAGAVPGSRAGTLLPPSIACCISWKIAARYRGGHPRTYLAGVSETDTETVTTFTAAFLGVALAKAAGYRQDINNIFTSPGNTLELGALSYVDAKAPRVVPLFRPFIGQGVNSRIDHQRRRDGR